ncbi:hypothetical protein MNJPNG_20070 [Cupriavidus oxalaticus]
MARPDRYEPTSHRLLDELCAHYALAVLPARPAKPRDKPKVEVAVQVVERWILARLRHQRFFSLATLNRAITTLVVELNQRPFKKLPGCRASAFTELDRPALRPLPATRMAIANYKRARVNIDYHVELDGHYYSVPHGLVGETVELRVTATTLEVLHGGKRVAAHPLNARRGALANGAPRSPRAGLPLLLGLDAFGAPVRRRPAGGRLRTCPVDSLAALQKHRLHSAQWTRPAPARRPPLPSRPPCPCTRTCAAPATTTEPSLTPKE